MQQSSQTKSELIDLEAYPRPKSTRHAFSFRSTISSEDIYALHPHIKIEIPYPLETVAAGFPSPAQDYTEKKIDLNEHLIHNPIATFILKVNSLSMKNAGIEIGDEILIDRSLDAEHGDVVLALINNEFTVKRFMHKKLSTGAYDIWLKAENPDFPDIHPHSEEQIMIWGVVTCILKKLK
ncbi:LexA family protein [Acinetobacter nematophilus]|uniref:Translesion error-prone DNA polymerase V autoproteolytic subunit n=1 Tax=Acinetobacter nematophilus TaxID=2994642 RepID=A0A9X3DSR2_9GAMM|nr:translesion error-prone DNA polymerase V autoproteolytic subunit [Acinetobacter nematophilus]MCX5467403.1 translesion error-prone DNA polymerase V autoproteolytic subunit [Acinetobacter nematophilus]